MAAANFVVITNGGVARSLEQPISTNSMPRAIFQGVAIGCRLSLKIDWNLEGSLSVAIWDDTAWIGGTASGTSYIFVAQTARQTDTHRQSHRQTYQWQQWDHVLIRSQTDRHTQTQTHAHRHRQTHAHRQTQTDTHTHRDRATGRHTNGNSEITSWYIADKKPQLLRHDDRESPILGVPQ